MNFTRKFKKRLLIIGGSILLFILLLIIFISPITKYLIEKYDEEYTGRQITMDYAYVNPFTGYIYFSNLKIHELNSDKVFFSAEGITLNVSVFKLLSSTYEITELTLDKPKGVVVQYKENFNFSDLIEKFSSKEDKDEEPAHFAILNIKINDGEFHFHEESIPIKYFIKKVNFESDGIRWDEDVIAVEFSFLSGIGSGDMKGDFTINSENLDYSLDVVANKFDLKIIEQYLKELTNYGSFTANLDADIKASGNLVDQDAVSIKGMLAINEFHFGKNPKDDYLSFDKLVLAIHEITPKKRIVFYDSISLSHPYFKYERYDHLDNLQMMFGKDGSNIAAAQGNPAKFNLVIEIAEFIKELSKNFFKSNYKINRLAIYKGDLEFNDYAISEKFSIELNPMTFIADSIYRSYERVDATFKTGILPYGYASVSISVNPKDSTDFEMRYNFQNLSLAMFNPYLVTYTSFPIDRGTLEMNGAWFVKNGIIQSNNHLVMVDPRVSKRVKNKDLRWVPMPFIMSLARDRGNVIDYEIPITRSLNDPKFHWKDVVFDVLTNIFIKPPTTPYRMEVKNIESVIEKSHTLKWPMRHVLIQSHQEKFMKRMVNFLEDNPEAIISVHPQIYSTKEKEYILLYEAKKKYFLVANKIKAQSYSEADSMKVEKMSAKDPLFVRYLNTVIKDSTLFTVQDKCMRFIGTSVVNTQFANLIKKRQNEFISFFEERGVQNRVKMYDGTSVVPYNGFSFYKIEYKGEIPKSLTKAYLKMNELNNEEPRKKYRRERKKNKNNL